MKFLRWLPNALTVLRIMLAFPVIAFLLEGRAQLTLLTLAIAVLTDLLDGFLARTFQARTAVGAWLDPAADKILITSVLVTLTVKSELPIWFCLITVGRDVGLVLGVVFLISRGVKVKIQPLLTGKFATFAQNLALLMAILAELGSFRTGVNTFIVISAAATLVSAVAYGRKFKHVFSGTSS